MMKYKAIIRRRDINLNLKIKTKNPAVNKSVGFFVMLFCSGINFQKLAKNQRI